MKVLVAFEFEDLDPNSEEADAIVNEIGEACEHMQVGFNASGCFIEDALGDVE